MPTDNALSPADQVHLRLDVVDHPRYSRGYLPMTMDRLRDCLATLLLLTVSVGLQAGEPVQIIDRFDTASDWIAIGAGAARASVSSEKTAKGSALSINFDFTQGGGEIMVHKSFPMTLPENYAISLKLRGNPSQPLELRLIDDSGKNVWRYHSPDYRVPSEWQSLRVKQRQFEFGWGPAAGGKPAKLGLIEFVIPRGAGGKGTLWVDDLTLEPLSPDQPYRGIPLIDASSTLPGYSPSQVLEDSPTSGWHSEPNRKAVWLQIDFGQPREYGGLIIDWDSRDYASNYRLDYSADGQHWQPAYTVRHGNGQRDYLPVPEAESRFLRLRMESDRRGRGYGIRHIEVAPLSFSSSANQLFERIAHDAPRGHYPRYLLGEQPYWTIAGNAGSMQAGAAREALLSMDGQIESDEGAFSIEPFLFTGGKLLTWADGNATPSLAHGYLPIPSVRLSRRQLDLTVSVLNPKRSGDPFLARYQLRNKGAQPFAGSLFLVVSPFLVNPPWQSLLGSGGVASIHHLAYRDAAFWIDGQPQVVALTRPERVGVAGFDQAPITTDLIHDRVPRNRTVNDALGKATGALRYAFSLAPGHKQDITLALPSRPASNLPKELVKRSWTRQYREVSGDWDTQLNQVRFQLPAEGETLTRALRSTLAYMLINRDGPALRPGSRRYNRTWIRDAAVTSTALLALGHAGEIREFLRWFAGYQGADGSIPCCLDPWGPDAMVEHDAVGEFIYTLANYYRYTRDKLFLEALWPHVVRSVDYLMALREQRLGAAFSQGEDQRYQGLLPESASHEGYISHPVHSYWDDFWALRGLDDAAWLAQEMGASDKAARYAIVRASMQRDVEQSIELTQKQFRVPYTPASADLGDFDPTSTAIAPILGMGTNSSLRPALRQTFQRYFAEVEARKQGTSNWKAYSPYEFRSVSAMVRLGERHASFATLSSLMDGRRPVEWNQWPEVVWRDSGLANFIGDLPHTWVGAEFIQAFLSLFAYENSGRQLVLAAGLPRAWVEAPGGAGVQGLHTAFGVLNYRVQSTQADITQVDIGTGIEVPAEGLIIDPPLPGPISGIEVSGKPATLTSGPLVIRELPVHIVFRHTGQNSDLTARPGAS